MEVNEEKVFLAMLRFKADWEIQMISELERIGLERICREYNVDYDDLNEAEKEEIWKELIAIVEEIEFVREFSELYEED